MEEEQIQQFSMTSEVQHQESAIAECQVRMRTIQWLPGCTASTGTAGKIQSIAGIAYTPSMLAVRTLLGHVKHPCNKQHADSVFQLCWIQHVQHPAWLQHLATDMQLLALV